MPRKKTEPATAPATEEKETITLSIEVNKALYEQILVTVKMCGFDSVDDWLMDAITNNV